MNETQKSLDVAPGVARHGESAVLRVARAAARRKKLVLLATLSGAALGVAISVATPDVYSAGTRLLPPQQQQSGAAALLSQLGGAAGMVGGVAGLKNPVDLYIGMLKSRTVADAMIKRFDLMKVYGTESPEKARRMLDSNTVVNARKDGLIAIEVEDTDKSLVAKLANGYVDELKKLTKVLAVTESSQRRLFFEQQLEQSKTNLAAAEIKFKNGLELRGMVSVDSDSRAIIETVGRLRAQVSAKEIELSSMRAFVTSNNQDYKRSEEELKSLKAELSNLENGRRAAGGENSANAEGQPGLENIKILRDVKYYQMLYELLAKQYEIARLDESKDASIIQVLDPAIDPERKIRPSRAFIVLMAALAGAIAGALLAVAFDWRATRKSAASLG